MVVVDVNGPIDLALDGGGRELAMTRNESISILRNIKINKFDNILQ